MKQLPILKPKRRFLVALAAIVLTVCTFAVVISLYEGHNRYVIKNLNSQWRLKYRSYCNETKQSLVRYVRDDEQEQELGISRLMAEKNRAGSIRNRHLIEASLNEFMSDEFLVILVQVHLRINYLRELIESLKQTKYIEQTLVVFSHDVYDDEMNKLINSIDFCAVLQIFYPYSMQVYKSRFPGKDPCDCPKNMKKAEALLLDCLNAAYPDSFGHNREAEFVQIKHHWSWKLSFIFERFKETKQRRNLQVLLIEEDHFLVPDAIHVLRKLNEKVLSDIDVISLGVFKKAEKTLESDEIDKYGKAIWHTSAHNTGLLISRAQYNMLKDCFHAFCTYDDYNWDWSLLYLSHSCFKNPLVAWFPLFSRVFHIGTCGTHHKSENCDTKGQVVAIKTAYEDYKERFFPNEFHLDGVDTGIKRVKLSNGGWSDRRDHQLCKQFFMSFDSSFNKSDAFNL